MEGRKEGRDEGGIVGREGSPVSREGVSVNREGGREGSTVTWVERGSPPPLLWWLR